MNAVIETLVCVAKDDRYDESNGAYTVFYLWDGEKVTTEGGMYSQLAYNAYTVDADRDQLKAASDYMRRTTEEGHAYNKYANNGVGAYTYVGCTVVLARSRTAPNKVELKVIAFHDRYYNERFNNWVSERITVVGVNGNEYTTSANCVKEVTQGVQDLPFWVI